MTPEKNLYLIESMINRAKDRFSEDGHLYLLWGWVVFFCSVGHFILLNVLKYEKHYMIWMVTWLVVVYQMIYLARKKKREKVKTYTDDIMGYVWLAFIASMFITGWIFARGQGENYYKLINPFFLMLYGIPTFLSGIILKFKPLIFGGAACWVLSLIATFIPYDYQLLLLSAAMIVAWIYPGYSLRNKYIKRAIMEDKENEFRPDESLRLIESRIHSTRRSIGDNSHYFLLWGWAVMIGCFIQFYLKAVADYQHHYFAWFITPLTLIVHFYFMSKDEKKTRVKTFIDEATGYLWIALGCSFIAFGFIFTKIGWQYSFPFYILMYGIGTYVSGALLKFQPLVLGGISCGILAIVTVYVPYDMQILSTALAMLLSYIIPGHILRNNYKKSKDY